MTAALEQAESAGRTAIAVGWDGQARGLLVVADTVKPTSAQAVAELVGLGLRPVLLTGDNERAARAVAAEVGIASVVAEVLPADKVDVVRGCSATAGWWRWSATGSTTPPPWPRPTWASPWAPAPMSPSRPATSPWSVVTCGRRRRHPAVPAHPGNHQGQPVLGVRLQRRGDPAGHGRPAQPAHRRRRDGVLVGVRGQQQPAAAPVPRRLHRLTADTLRRPTSAVPCSVSEVSS